VEELKNQIILSGLELSDEEMNCLINIAMQINKKSGYTIQDALLKTINIMRG
jgi:hypothetical protein